MYWELWMSKRPTFIRTKKHLAAQCYNIEAVDPEAAAQWKQL